MFVASLMCLRTAAARSTELPSLRRRLQRLRQTNRVAERQLHERRRLHRLLGRTKTNGHTAGHAGADHSNDSDEATSRAICLLPRNDALEAAMALSISENRDARTELELVRRLINSTLLSLASPVDRKWDPYDVKPQVFALNTYIALPVFTSIRYLQLFCQRFGFAVRDPSGVLWAAGAVSTEEGNNVDVAGLLPDGLVWSKWWPHHLHAQQQMCTEEVHVGDGAKGSVSDAYPSSGIVEERSVNASKITTDDTTNATIAAGRGSSADVLSASAAGVDATSMDASKFEGQSSAPSSSPLDQNAPPAVDPAGPWMDATWLFDAMAMDGVAKGMTLGTPVKKTPRKKQTRKVGELKASSSSNTPARHQPTRSDSRLRLLKRQRRLRAKKHSVLRGVGREATGASRFVTSKLVNNDQTEEEKQKEQEEKAAKAAYWQAVAQTSPFDLKQATPLPTFGPFLYPFLLGYFADISTLLHNAAIVPEKVDIVVNPGSPIEFVLARAATDRVLRKEQLLHLAYLKVEKELQHEFSNFFALYCPEVLYASSACVPLPMDMAPTETVRRVSRSGVGSSLSLSNPLQDYRERTRLLREAEYRNGVTYELVILIQSTSLEETFMKIQKGKHQSMLMGHVDLDVLPEAAAAPHVREMAHVFYDRVSEQEKLRTLQSIESRAAGDAKGGVDGERVRSGFSDSQATIAATRRGGAAARMGVFMRRGIPVTINVTQSADSYYHDPTNAYTEAHSVFTEELKVKRGQ